MAKRRKKSKGGSPFAFLVVIICIFIMFIRSNSPEKNDTNQQAQTTQQSVIPTPTPTATPAPTATPEPTPTPAPKSVSYSTNTEETVNNGNSGVYAYKNKGGSYSVYYIIDFDEGYVYYFLDGNGDMSCDRVKIDSGDLNNGVIITYHDGGSTWQESLHFKSKNQPNHLIWVDHNNFEYDFYTTDLEKALAIRDTKTIKDY